jgi:DNA-binding MarR family transcriptional regulator
MVTNKSNEEIIKKINELYILNRWKYLILNKEGEYRTNIYQKNNPKDGTQPLTDWRIDFHLQGKQTIGVFAGKKNNIEISKFICFDIDLQDKTLSHKQNKELSKWCVYKIFNELQNCGISEEFINISFSGKKGYHIELFFDMPIEVSILKKFYNYILNQISLNQNEVEFRPTYNQGVKIPLGLNFKNTEMFEDNKCWYVTYENGLKPIKKTKYILNIKQLDNIYFRLLMDKIFDNNEETNNNISDYSYIKINHKPLKSYKENIDKDITIESIEKLEKMGLTTYGTRHNSILKLSKYYRYLGLTKEDAMLELKQWMSSQDKRLYSTSWDECIKEIERIVSITYNNEYQLVTTIKDINIYYEEMKQILNLKNKNEKLLMYSFLIHGKRYANKYGVFYFPYSLIEKTTGLTDKTITKLINALEEDNYIEILSRNQNSIKNGVFVGKETNKYKIKIEIISDEDFYTIHENDVIIDTFNRCIVKWFDKKEIKDLCGRRHYESILEYIENNNIITTA